MQTFNQIPPQEAEKKITLNDSAETDTAAATKVRSNNAKRRNSITKHFALINKTTSIKVSRRPSNQIINRGTKSYAQAFVSACNRLEL